MSDTDDPLRLNRLTELVTTPRLPIGAQVLVQETGEIFFSAGNTTAEIAAALGWHQENAWVPDDALRYIRRRHPEFPLPLLAISTVLSQPSAVYIHPDDPTTLQFFADAEVLRHGDLLRSRSVRHVDVMVELRATRLGPYLRVFHVSPARRPKAGPVLWP